MSETYALVSEAQPSAARAARKPNRVAIFMSAFAFPGVGQFMQGRPLAGVLYCVIALTLFLALAAEVFVPLFRNLSAALDFAEGRPGGPMSGVNIRGIVVTALVLLAVFVANVLDVVLAHMRLSRRWNEARPEARLVGERTCK